MSPQVYAPNIYLFAFTLQNNLDDNWLWQSCDEIIKKSLHKKLDLTQWLDLHKEPNNPRVALIKAEKVQNNNFAIPLDGEVSLDGKPLKLTGFVQPLRIYDSYGLWLNLRRPDTENGERTEDVNIQLFSKLNPDNCWLLGGSARFLGETLLITAWLTENDPQDQTSVKNLADDCLKAFFPENYNIPLLYRKYTLFGSSIFEYGLLNQSNDYRHILVWLFRDTEADEKLKLCQQQLLDLFFFRHKVIAAFKKSRELHKEANKEYEKIENEIKDLHQPGKETDLEELENKLKNLPSLALSYDDFLRYLEDYQNTIAINTRNYNERLQQIRSILIDEDISFLETFSNEYSTYFQEQIKADLGYFNHGSGLLDKAIASIRGRVEIDRSKSDSLSENAKQISDRNLQITILAVGTSIGVGGIVASSYTLVTKEEPLLPPFSTSIPHRFTISIFGSLALGLVAGLLIWGVDRCLQSLKKRS